MISVSIPLFAANMVPGAAEAGHDLVGDDKHAIAFANALHLVRIRG